MLRIPALAAFLLAIAGSPAMAQNVALLSIAHAPGAQVPHGLVIQHLGLTLASGPRALNWVDAGARADFSVIPAQEALARRAAGADLKVVYVVSRADRDVQVLVVSERLLSENASQVEGVVALFERARRWLNGNPAEAAAVVARGAGVAQETALEQLSRREFNVARPGPALAQTLKAGAGATLAAQVDALLDDGPLRGASARGFEPARRAALVSRLN